MTLFQAFALGLVQGLTEFLPVSSSGHLILIPRLFGWEAQSLAFDAMIHLATLGAILAALCPEVKQVARGMAKNDNWGKLGWMILVATIPVVIVGLLFKESIETTLRHPDVVAASLAFWGIVLYVADRNVGKKAENQVEKTGWRRALAIGLAQAVALIPGTSRSGITVSFGMLTGLSRDAATRFAFLLGIPAIAGAGALAVMEFAANGIDVSLAALAVGFVTAFLSGFLAIRFLLSLLKRGNFTHFAMYRIALAILILTLF